MFDQYLGSIPADHYWRDDVLPRELDAIFARTWLYVGSTDDLGQHQDFITTTIGTHSIVVQNFKGELKAFRNVCSHRLSRIQTAPCGNRRLQCPYHGWLYDAAGRPAGVPQNDQAFGLSDADRDALALKAYRLETCGRFVFACLSDDVVSLRDYLGQVYDDLEHFSAVCSHRISTTSVEMDVNWKVGLENAAEGYHVRVIHGDSLGPTLGDDISVDFIADHSLYVRGLTDDTRAWWDRVSKIIKLQPSPRFPDSTNYIIFPHTVVLATYGASFVLQTYEPITATRFRCNTAYWIADSRPGPARDAVADNLRSLSARIMAEDASVCHGVQAGVRDVPNARAPLLGLPENRIAHFQKAYARHMAAHREDAA